MPVRDTAQGKPLRDKCLDTPLKLLPAFEHRTHPADQDSVSNALQLPPVENCLPMQCPLSGSQDPAPLLLLDVIDLQAHHPSTLDSSDPEESRAPFVLLPDPAVPERVYVRSALGAWAVCLTWLPALSSWMSEGEFWVL